jgi:hypothetical protein
MDNIMTQDRPIAAVDFETTYDKECSINPLGWDAYFRHPNFECYLVAIKTTDGIEFVGHPKDAPWNEIADHHWIAHNTAFDENLYLIAQELGWWGNLPTPPVWDCTMDLAAYCGEPHSLKNAVHSVFNVELSKEVRNAAAGKRPPKHWECVHKDIPEGIWEPMTDKDWDAMLAYALDDAVWCLKLWEARADRWPEHERNLSRHTRTIARRGVPCDIDKAIAAAASLKDVLFEFENCIPWTGEHKLLSRAAFNRQCKVCGLTPPKSLAQDNPESEDWLVANEKEHQWIYAYRNWRKANALLKKVEAVIRATRNVGDHYRYFGHMKYCGAHTKRWSGSGGNLNMQNPPKGTQHFECNGSEATFRFRDFFCAAPGTVMAALDLSQIEVRTLAWLSRDKEMLKRIAESPDIYQAFAEAFGLWDPEKGSMKEVDPDLRNFTKPVVLGSGFGASAWAFAEKESDQLRKAVDRKYAGEPIEKQREDAMAWLETMKSEVGTWWWKKAGRMLDRYATVDVELETASGKPFVGKREQWKEFVKYVEDLDGKLNRHADVPIELERWEWDIQSVLVMKEATYCVGLYRGTMKKVTAFWEKLTSILKGSVLDRHMEFILPSGNKMVYKNVTALRPKPKAKETEEERKKRESEGVQIFCTIVRNGQKKQMKPWYGLLTENLAQSLARDVFGHILLALEAAGFEILFHVHDEVVVLLPKDSAKERIAEAEKIMSVAPDWIPSLPVEAEGNFGETYADCK